MMVKSIVIPHDPTRSPRLHEMVDAGDFQAAVDGWLELIEMPALGVTVYVNEAARREHAPINCRAMAIWWFYTADPTQYPVFLGDVVLSGIGGDEETGDVPESVVRDIFETKEFVVQVQAHGTRAWHDTFARFESIFDAATWCMLFTTTLRRGALLRLRSRSTLPDSFDDSFRGSDAPW